MAASVALSRSKQTSTSGGSRDSEVTAFAVVPTGLPSAPTEVTTVTPVAKSPIASRSPAGETSVASASGTWGFLAAPTGAFGIGNPPGRSWRGPYGRAPGRRSRLSSGPIIVNNYDQLSRYLGADRLLAGLASCGAYLVTGWGWGKGRTAVRAA